MKIALFATCIVDAMHPRVALATVRILERLGHEVVFPPGQGCCSQMHVNSGYLDDAVPIVRNHVRSFQKADYDVAVATSASCVASLGHQQPMVARRAGDEGLARDAEEVASNTYELSQLLTDVLGVTDAGAQLGSWFPHTVTYHPSCHGMRLLRLGDRQVDLVRSVEDIDYRELPDAQECCGFGGTFSLKNPDVSAAIAEEKIEKVTASGASLCTGGDASCLLHLDGAMHRREARGQDGRPLRTVPLVTASKVEGAGPLRKLTSVLGLPLTLLVALGILVGVVLVSRRRRGGRRATAG